MLLKFWVKQEGPKRLILKEIRDISLYKSNRVFISLLLLGALCTGCSDRKKNHNTQQNQSKTKLHIKPGIKAPKIITEEPDLKDDQLRETPTKDKIKQESVTSDSERGSSKNETTPSQRKKKKVRFTIPLQTTPKIGGGNKKIRERQLTPLTKPME